MQVKITQVVFPVCLSCMSEFDQIHISTDVKRVWISTQLPSSKHVPAVVHGQVCYATCTLIGYTNPCCMDLSRASFTNAGSLCKENLAQCHMMCLHVKFSHWTHPYGYESESRTLTAEPQRRIQATEMRCYRKILCISYKEHVTNKEAHAKIQQAIGPHEDLLTMVKRCKLQWYGHVSRSSGLAKTILQGTVKGGRRQGGQRKRWDDIIRDWTGLEFAKSQRVVENRENRRKLVAKSPVVPQQPSWLRDRWDEIRDTSKTAIRISPLNPYHMRKERI